MMANKRPAQSVWYSACSGLLVFSSLALPTAYAIEKRFDRTVGQIDMKHFQCDSGSAASPHCPKRSQQVAKNHQQPIKDMLSEKPKPVPSVKMSSSSATVETEPVVDSGKFAYRGSGRAQREVVKRIDCRGGLSIYLDPSDHHGKPGVHAARSTFSYDEHGRVLEFSGPRGRGQYDVIIRGADFVKQIETVNLYDSCSLSGDGLKQSVWQLNSETTGAVSLKGMFERCTILQTASNQISMYWVGSNAVDVVSRAGVMHLAGAVDHARIRASGDSQLTVKQLRAHNAWLYATGDAFVEMFGSRRLIVFSDGAARILADGVPMFKSESSIEHSMFVID